MLELFGGHDKKTQAIMASKIAVITHSAQQLASSSFSLGVAGSRLMMSMLLCFLVVIKFCNVILGLTKTFKFR